MSKNALVIIDVQNYFVSKHTKTSSKKIKNLYKLIDFDYVTFSKYINNLKSNHYKILQWDECQNSPSIDIDVELLEISTSTNDTSRFIILETSLRTIHHYLYIKRFILITGSKVISDISRFWRS